MATVKGGNTTGPSDVAIDEVGGEDVQRVKLVFGDATTATRVSSADPLPVALDAASLSALETIELGATSLAALESITASGPLTDAQLRAAAVPVSAASLPLPSGASTAANQTTIIGHVDGIEGLLTTIDADTGTLAGAVAGSEMQVDIITSALPTGAATAAKQPALGTAGTPSADVISIQGVASGTVVPVADGGGSLTVDGTVTANLAAGTNNIGDVDVLSVPAPLSTTGSGTEATALRVTLATDSTGLVSVDDNGGSLTVDGTVAVSGTVAVTQSGTWDEVGINDSGNSITVDNPQLSVVGTGTEAAALRVTIATDSTGVLSVDDNGGTLSIDDGAGSITVDGTVAATQSGTWNVTNVSGTVSLPTGASTLAEQQTQTTHLSNIATSVGTLDNAISGSEMQVDIVSMPAVDTELTTADLDTGAGTDTRAVVGIVGSASGGGELIPGSATDGLLVNLGANNDVTVTGTVTANLAAGTNNIGDVDILSIAAGDNNIGNVDVVTLPNVTIGTMAALVAGTANIGDVDVLTVPAPLSTTGGGTEATALRVTVANDSTGVLSVDDNGGSLTVDGTVGVSGTVTIAGAVTNAGTFAVQVDGSALTALQLIDDAVQTEDGAHTTGEKGVSILGVRRDTAASSSGTDGDYSTVNLDASGRLWTHDPVAVALLTTIDTDTGTVAGAVAGSEMQVDVVAALPAGTNAIGKLAANSGVDIGDVDVTSVPAPLSTAGGGTEATALRVTVANDSTGVLSVDDNGGSLTVDGTVTANLAAGTNNIGDVDVLSIVGAATLANGQVAPTNTAATLVAARTGRRRLILLNYGTVTVYVGIATVTTANGFPIDPGASLTLETSALVQAITASGTGAIAYLEEY